MSEQESLDLFELRLVRLLKLRTEPAVRPIVASDIARGASAEAKRTRPYRTRPRLLPTAAWAMAVMAVGVALATVAIVGLGGLNSRKQTPPPSQPAVAATPAPTLAPASPTPCVSVPREGQPTVTSSTENSLRTELAFWQPDAVHYAYAVVAQNTNADAFVRLRVTLEDACANSYTDELSLGDMRRDETRAFVGHVKDGFYPTQVDTAVVSYPHRNAIPYVGECKGAAQGEGPAGQPTTTGYFDWYRTWLPRIVATAVYRDSDGRLIGADTVGLDRPPIDRRGSVIEVPRTVASPSISRVELNCFVLRLPDGF